MPPTLTALLCLGLSVGLRTPVQAGTLPKPTLWAEPGPLVPPFSPVTIWCQESLQAQEFRLDKEGSTAPWDRQKPLDPRNKAKFSITYMQSYAGRYRCYYLSQGVWSEHSDPLELVVTGFSYYSKPSLSALPSPVVTSGGTVTLQCGSWQGFDRFILTKEGEDRLSSWTLDSQPHPSGQVQALFPVGPVTPSDRWTFRCYGCYRNRPHQWSLPSDSLELLVSALLNSCLLLKSSSSSSSMFPKFLSLLGLGFCLGQRMWTLAGGHVTLQCHSHPPFTSFKLTKRSGTPSPELQRDYINTFTMSSVTMAHAGSYRCFGRHSHTSGWSVSSNALDIIVSGVFKKPSLSAQPGSLVHTGEAVTLRCHSELVFDQFVLRKDEDTQHSWQVVEKLHARNRQAHFSMGPMTPARAGTYRCYGSFHHSPYEWSAPSDPLKVVITGMQKKPTLSAQPGPTVMSGDNVTLFCHSESPNSLYHICREGEAHGCWLAGGQSHHGVFQVDFPLGPATSAHTGTYRCYSSFNHSHAWSHPSDPLHLAVTGSSTSTFLSPTESSTRKEAPPPQGDSSKLHILTGLSLAFLLIGISLAALLCYWCSIKNRAAWREPEPKEDQMMNGKDPAAEDTHDVIYAQLTLQQRGFTPSSLSTKDVSTEPSVYMEFKVNQAHAEARPGPGL
ncbi:LOW QUALITY PROTEIN: leukocyte immunoglobulin-like receptor subfamily A member 6 [Glossophaga mutica]